jgi:phosphate acetyltransferase
MQQFIDRARQGKHRVVYAEGAEPRILQAARQVVDQEIAEVILLGTEQAIAEVAAAEGISLDGFDIVDPTASDCLDSYAALYLQSREQAKPGMAARLVRKPLYFASMMVKAGDADLVVAGIANPTRRVIEAASLCIGFAPGINVPSSFFLMNIPGREQPLVFADCAVNVDPTADQLAQIAVASAHSAQQLFGEPPRVAMLSFSTHGSAAHAQVDKVIEAVNIARKLDPELHVDGELQADAALSAAVAASKLKGESAVAGHANVLIFPDLNSGNIGYKLTQQLAGAEAVGPLLQGFARPVADLSRGASVEEVVVTTAVALANTPELV